MHGLHVIGEFNKMDQKTIFKAQGYQRVKASFQ